jgi:hypothetical protein
MDYLQETASPELKRAFDDLANKVQSEIDRKNLKPTPPGQIRNIQAQNAAQIKPDDLVKALMTGLSKR